MQTLQEAWFQVVDEWLWHPAMKEGVMNRRSGVKRLYIAPLPWRVDYESGGAEWTNSCSILDADGGHVCHLTRGYQAAEDGDGCPSWDNAELIVSAVNNLFHHYAFGKELREAQTRK